MHQLPSVLLSIMSVLLPGNLGVSDSKLFLGQCDEQQIDSVVSRSPTTDESTLAVASTCVRPPLDLLPETLSDNGGDSTNKNEEHNSSPPTKFVSLLSRPAELPPPICKDCRVSGLLSSPHPSSLASPPSSWTIGPSSWTCKQPEDPIEESSRASSRKRPASEAASSALSERTSSPSHSHKQSARVVSTCGTAMSRRFFRPITRLLVLLKPLSVSTVKAQRPGMRMPAAVAQPRDRAGAAAR